MRRLLLICVALLYVCLSYGQNRLPYNIGYYGIKTPPGATVRTPFAGGQVVATKHKDVSDYKVMCGFKFDILYIDLTFTEDLFASKGYYANFVELKWDVNANASNITRFKIYRKEYNTEGDSTLVASISADERSWKDEYAESNQIYKYTLFAEGITSDFVEPYIDYIEGIGFRIPTATVSGRITYEGGTAVEGVKVIAETEDDFGGSSAYLNGVDSYLSVPYNDNDKFNLDTAFTFQGWFLPDGTSSTCLFSKGSQYEIMHQQNQINFTIGGTTTLTANFTEKPDTFFHVAATYANNVAKLYIIYDNETYWMEETAVSSDPPAEDNDLLFGFDSNYITSHYKGTMDELRIWYSALDSATIFDSYGLYIDGTQKYLSAYYRLDEATGDLIFDIARSGYNFYENHGGAHNVQWTDKVPLREQLSHKGVTDSEGNYIITGIPFATDGSTYTITPMLSSHQFEPTQTLLYINENDVTHNNINFTDVASFRVTGSIRYRDTYFPVEDVFIKVDGKTAVDSDGSAITTDRYGNFSIDVPIGQHYISVTKQGHDFDDFGRFPPEADSYYDFQEAISGLEFIDTTLVKVIGRVVGGPVQEAKKLGFGKSTNNIGNATITLTTEKGYDLTDNADGNTGSWDNNYIKGGEEANSGNTNFDINTVSIEINPDESTGEFTAYLLPEVYNITSVTAGNYTFGEEFHTSLDISNAFIWQSISDTTVIGQIIMPNGDVVDETRIDSVNYQQRKDFIYRTSPTVSVTKKDRSKAFWETELIEKEDTITLVDDNNDPLTAFPVFNQRTKYNLKISVYERYVNANQDDAVDDVPVTDGKAEVVNSLAINDSKVQLALDSQGEANYSFTAGLPNISENGDESYVKTMNITVFTGDNGSIATEWKYNNDYFKGYVFGGLPTGNNFVTNGPNKVDMVLRDPPGSGSSATLEQGQSISKTTTTSISHNESGTEELTLQLGATVKVWAGIGAGVITETEYDNDITVGLEHEETWLDENTTTSTTTTTKAWSTSDSPDYVGAMGDVFIGHSTNIVYGQSRFIQLVKTEDCDGDCFGPEVDGYRVGTKVGVRFNPEFGTAFMYSQNHIVNYLIPNLEMLRNNFLTRGDNVYVSALTTDDEDYGSDNNDTISHTQNQLVGDSYTINIPVSWPDDSLFVDSVHVFNQQIKGWEKVLAQNERDKAEAKLVENLSFDAGVTYEKSLEVEAEQEEVSSFEFVISPTLEYETGFNFNKFGLKVDIEESYSYTNTEEDGTTTTSTTNVSYTLQETEGGDYISVDVKEPKTPTGPVFYSRGGQTSCPYEGEIVTEYYNPGTIISEATMQIEVPVIDVENAIITGIPEDQAGVYTLYLKNESQTGDDSWFLLEIDDETNPDGAKILLDGTPIGNGRMILVPAESTTTKTVTLGMTKPDVFDYEDVTLILHSVCQFDPTGDLNDIADSVSISAHFQAACSGVEITSPVDKWVINTNTGENMTIGVDNYNLEHASFEKILFQYKPTSSSQWNTNMVFYVDEDDYEAADIPKYKIDGQSSIDYDWDMSSLIDRNYNIRLLTICDDGTENSSEILTGIKDVKRPQLFGSPQPADGILSPNDEVMVSFDEDIEEGLLTPFNFSVSGVLNGSDLNHNASVYFDGNSGYASVYQGVNLKDKSFSVEFWANRNSNGEMVVLSQGGEFEIGFDSSDRFYLKLGNQTITSNNTYTTINTWEHWGVVYDDETKIIELYKDDDYIVENIDFVSDFTGVGKMYIGKSNDDTKYFEGAVHELRVWAKTIPLGDFFAKSMQSLTGDEIGIVGYWPMDEAFGNMAQDKARDRHATLYNTDWQVLPIKYAREFDGIDDYIEIATASSVIITDEMDLTIEFWFKAPNQTNTTLFSNGKGDGTDLIPSADNALSIGINSSGEIFAQNNGTTITISGEDYLDENWHHLALVLSRNANTSLYIDGNLKAYKHSNYFGGIVGDKMALGARRYDALAVKDQFYNGLLDEVRIWNLARTSKQLNMDRNAKLTGTEKGLVAYYPFEQYNSVMGAEIIQSSLDDNYIPPYEGWSNGGTATANGGDFVTNTPNIKDARPVQKVQFTWAVNDDKIIINIDEPQEVVEKTVLEFTVDRIQDLNENRLASPITWTAYVNRNQIVWDAVELNYEKKLHDPLSFNVDILNTGGVQQNFSIENLPAWLSASPSEGEIDPDSRMTLEFTIDQYANIGKFEESIYLRSDFGYDEKLTINLKVYEDAPDWSVNADNFQYSMNVIAQLSINNNISTNEDDIVAAFINGECRGVASPKYIPEYDMYELFLNIYSNKNSSEEITFKIWDADKGVIHTDVTPELTFVSNTYYGTPSAPEMLYALSTYELDIPLSKGWNWMSFNLLSELQIDPDLLFDGMAFDNGDQIKGRDAFENYTVSSGWNGTITPTGGLKNEEMYLVNISNVDTLTIIGTSLDPLSTPITINEGWNYIGYIPSMNIPTKTALSNLNSTTNDLIKSQTNFAMYDEALGWIGSLNYLSPGEGYMLYSQNADVLTYPESGLLKAGISEDNFDTKSYGVSVENYQTNMSVVATLQNSNSERIQKPLQLVAFIEGECRGEIKAVEVGDNNYLYFLPVYGNAQGENISFRAYSNDFSSSSMADETLSYAQNSISGSISNPVLLTVDDANLSDNESEGFNGTTFNVYPNPFDNELIVTGYLENNEDVQIQLIDQMGRKIHYTEEALVSGENSITISGKDIPPGIYYVSILCNNTIKVFKVVKE